MGYNFDELINREHTDSVKYDLRKLLFGTENVIPLWVADMDFRASEKIIKAITQHAEHGLYGYSVLPKNYHESIMSWTEKRYGWKIKKPWITSCPGVVPSMAVAILAFTNEGDKIIVQPPVYPPFFSVVQDNDREMVINELVLQSGKYQIDFDDLEEKAAQGAKMLILSNPHNPVGRVWNKEELAKMGEICLRYGMLIVSDEIHADVIYPPHRFYPTASLSEEIANITISCLAPSKTFNIAGLSSSYTIIPNQNLNNRFKKQLAALGLNHGNYFGPKALEAAYLHGGEWLDKVLDYMHHNIKFTMHYIDEHIPEIKAIMPEGTYLIWLDCRGLQMNDQELKRFMVHKAKLGLNDGPTFGPGGSGFQRMNIACPTSVLKVALNNLKEAVSDWRQLKEQ